MAKPSAEAPRRWAEESQASDDRRLAELFRRVADPGPLPAAGLAQLHDRLGSKRASRLSRRMRELVMAMSMLLLGSSLALAGWGASEWLSGRSQRAQQPPSGTAAQQVRNTLSERPRAQAQKPVEAPLALEPAAPIASGQSEVLLEPSSKANAARSSEHASVPPADSSTLAAEALALERALAKLRREHDAQGALTVLDESRALFEKGSLALEARVARVDALLALGRRDEALALLEQLPLTRIGRGGELQLMRAELRATKDCALALADFDLLVTRALAPPLLERALYGRAACELSVGDVSHAEQDLTRYLARFPEGRFATQVESQLSKLHGKAR